jgi:hypothetical protein
VLQVSTPLSLHASELLPDGTLYPLGTIDTRVSQAELRVTRDGAHVTVVVDAAPADVCFTLEGLLTMSRCTLFVESAGDLTPLATD